MDTIGDQIVPSANFWVMQVRDTFQKDKNKTKHNHDHTLVCYVFYLVTIPNYIAPHNEIENVIPVCTLKLNNEHELECVCARTRARSTCVENISMKSFTEHKQHILMKHKFAQ